MTEEPSSLGERISFYRKRRGLSQTAFARLIDRSESWVSQVERDVRQVDRVSVIAKLAAVLEVSLTTLAPDVPTTGGGSQSPEIDALRLLLVGHPALDVVLSPVRPGHVDVGSLADRVASVWEDVHSSRYQQAAPDLTAVLGDLETTARTSGPNDSGALAAATASAYQAASAVLAKIGDSGAAWVASDRALAAAERAGEAGLVVAGQFRLVLALLSMGRPADALHAAERAIEAVAGATTPDAGLTALAGALHLASAVAAARLGDRQLAWEHIHAAQTAADKLDEGRNDYGTEFGRANVALHAVSVAVELGDAGEALARAQAVDVSRLSVERRARFLIDVASANVQRRRHAEAIEALLEAESLAPEQARNHPVVRTLVRDLSIAARGSDTGLDGLVSRVLGN